MNGEPDDLARGGDKRPEQRTPDKEFTGRKTRKWLSGGFFLVQRMQMAGEGPSDAAEYIGYDSSDGTLRSMLFGAGGPGPFCHFALDYVWEVDGTQLTIWHGWVGSPAFFTGEIDPEGVITGRWEWPDGGDEAIARRDPG
jgi:hypothetical protein